MKPVTIYFLSSAIISTVYIPPPFVHVYTTVYGSFMQHRISCVKLAFSVQYYSEQRKVLQHDLLWTPQNTKRSLPDCHHWYIYLMVFCDSRHTFHAHIHLLCTLVHGKIWDDWLTVCCYTSVQEHFDGSQLNTDSFSIAGCHRALANQTMILNKWALASAVSVKMSLNNITKKTCTCTRPPEATVW
mgnify:CR=1 FL=1